MTNVIWENGEFSPTQIEEISEAFTGDLDKAKAVYIDFTDGCFYGMDLGDLTQIGGEIARGIPYTEQSHCWVDAETDDVALLEKWGSYEPEQGHEYFCVVDEKDDGKPEMTKQFKLLFKVPQLEVLSFTASLTEAGFSQVVSRPMKAKPTSDEAQVGDEVVF
jgi:hypothetical protein